MRPTDVYPPVDRRGYYTFINKVSLPGTVSPLYRRWNLTIKRMVDITVSSLLILGLLTWLLPVIALLIKIGSKGPVFFLQERRKRGKAAFSCIKLRTMVASAEANTRIAFQQDERITAMGKWLRETHLDELPQLFNVWWGDMSLIGPRPYMLHEDLLFELNMEGHNTRNSVKPGITGLAQSFGFFGATRNIADMEKRLSLDIRYIQQWSLFMDASILLRSIRFLRPR